MQDGFRVNTDRMSNQAQACRRSADDIQRIAGQIISCRDQLQLNTASTVHLKLQIGRLYDQALTNAAQMDTLAEAMDQIVQLYIACDNRIAGNAAQTAENAAVFSEDGETGTDKRSWWRKFWDWLWKKDDIDTGYTHTSSAQEAAADAHMQQQIQRLNNNERYSEEAWANATVEERKSILSDYMREVMAIMGLDITASINFTNTPPSNGRINMGSYSHSNRTVSINEYVIANRSPESSYALLTTIVHELRHAYQHAAVDNPTRYQVSQETIDAWSESFDTYQAEYQRSVRENDIEIYRNIVVERDARWFAGQD